MREYLKDKKRIVIKIGSSALFHTETGKLNYTKMERLVRIITDTANQGRDVVLVSSGAIATGKNTVGISLEDASLPVRQACAAIGQAKLITVYQRLFSEYNRTAAQILITNYTIERDVSRQNAANTFEELFDLGAIPVVNENDTVTTEEIEFGDNDRLSALVAVLTEADLLIILSDIDGLYDSDPHKNADAKFISCVEELDEKILGMGGGKGSAYGTGGMVSKLEAAKITKDAGIDMVITNADDVDNIARILSGEETGTLFKA